MKFALNSILLSLVICLVSACNDDPRLNFTPKEKIVYDRLMEDYERSDIRWGFIDTFENVVIDFKYEDARDFQNNVAAILDKVAWGLIDKMGNYVLEPRFVQINQGSESPIVAKTLLDGYLLFTYDGHLISDTIYYDEVYAFSNGLCKVEKATLYGYIDTTGTLTIPLEYEDADDFTNDIAIVGKDGQKGLIDKNGTLIVPMEYNALYKSSSGLIRFNKQEKYGYMDARGTEVISPRYTFATDFIEDYAVVSRGENNYALIDKSGNLRDLPYSLVDIGGEGKWMYAADGKFGFLKNDGTLLSMPLYDMLLRYSDGMAGFALQGNWGYLDKNGEEHLPPIFPLIWDFKNGAARMITPYGFGLMDKDANNIIQPKYKELRDFSEGLARAGK